MRYDDEKDPGTAALAAVAGLARSVESLTRDVAAMKKGLQQTATAAEVTRLARIVTELGEVLTQAPARRGDGKAAETSPAEGVRSWLRLAEDQAAVEQVLSELLPWMQTTYLRYGDAREALPPCWLWHPEIVEELLWLMDAWTAAYQGPDASNKLVGDWHDRQRPGVTKRVAAYAPGCDALGLTGPAAAEHAKPTVEAATTAEQSTAPVWLVAYLLGALRTAPVHHSTRTAPTAPVHEDTANGAPAPAQTPHRTTNTTEQARPPRKAAPKNSRDDRTDSEMLAVLRDHSAAEHDGGPLSQQEVRRVTGVGFRRAKRLVALAGWAQPSPQPGSTTATTTHETTETKGQLQLVTEPDENPTENDDETTTDRELETSSSR
jgi:hypothetical protein